MSFRSFISALPHWLDRQATSGRLCLAIVVAVLLQLAMMPLDQHLHLVSGGLGKPSLIFGSSAGALRQHLLDFGAEGRRTLVKLYLIDLIFPSALAAVIIQAGWLAFRRVLPGLAFAVIWHSRQLRSVRPAGKTLILCHSGSISAGSNRRTGLYCGNYHR